MAKLFSHSARSENGHLTAGWNCPSGPDFWQEWTRPLLGTLVSIGVSGVPPGEAAAMLERGFAAIERVQTLMSFHAASGDVATINAAPAGATVRVDPQTHDVLRMAVRVSAASAGVFDITVGAAAVASGRLPAPPGRPADPAARWTDLHLEAPDRVTLRRNLWVDLGGIAKGYAVDLAMAALRLPPAANARVNAGGDLRVAGPDLQSIVLRVPGHPSAQQPMIELCDGSLASSAADGGPTSHFDGRRFNDPGADELHRANARRAVEFVSVVAPCCAQADALTKVVLALGTDAAKVLAAFGTSAYLYAPEQGWQVVGGEKR